MTYVNIRCGSLSDGHPKAGHSLECLRDGNEENCSICKSIKKKHPESFDPMITRHVGYFKQAYEAALAFGAGTLSNVREQLLDHGITITDKEFFDFSQELDAKRKEWNEL